jgi:hypothetical protein
MSKIRQVKIVHKKAYFVMVSLSTNFSGQGWVSIPGQYHLDSIYSVSHKDEVSLISSHGCQMDGGLLIISLNVIW